MRKLWFCIFPLNLCIYARYKSLSNVNKHAIHSLHIAVRSCMLKKMVSDETCLSNNDNLMHN